MRADPPSSFDPLPTTPARLTAELREFGSMESGEVEHLEVTERIQTTVSNLWFLKATWSRDVTPALPERLLLKWPLVVHPPPDDCQEEPTFYRSLAPRLNRPVTVPALAASPNIGRQWLVLEDVRATHSHPHWPQRPSDDQLRTAVSVLAAVHARWWGAREDDGHSWTYHTEDSLSTMVAGIRRHLPGFLDHLGDSLSTQDRATLETVFGSSLRPWLRLAERRALTLAHGDAHTWNFLFPRSGEGNTYLIDWQTWHLDVGARDLAYMMALHWDPDVRAGLERPLLELYYQRLPAEQMAGYSFDDLWLDYRRCAVRNLTFPIINWSRGFAPEVWRDRLNCALAAYRDLGGHELL